MLRGTNLDDKRNGTIEVVKKKVIAKSNGAFSHTRHRGFALITNDFPDTLTNKML